MNRQAPPVAQAPCYLTFTCDACHSGAATIYKTLNSSLITIDSG